MYTLLLLVDLIVAVAIVVLVLLQQGKGADMGAAFGSGASGSLFGASGSANFLSRTTAILATIFFAVSLALSWLTAHEHAIAVPHPAVPVTKPATAPAPETGKAAAPTAPADVPSATPPANSGAQGIPK